MTESATRSEAWYSQDDKDTWRTPKWITDALNKYDNIDLDPCADENSEIGDENLTIEDNGLVHEWNGVLYINMPFSEKGSWLQKLETELEWGNVKRAYVLTPAAPDRKSWWHSYIAERANHVWFPYGRVKFVDPESGEQKGSPTFGSAISCFGQEPPEELIEWFKEDEDGNYNGWVVKTV